MNDIAYAADDWRVQCAIGECRTILSWRYKTNSPANLQHHLENEHQMQMDTGGKRVKEAQALPFYSQEAL